MKSEFLKLAGVKSEKAFYKKYPTEAAFFKAHPEAKKQIKKAQIGTIISGGNSLSNPNIVGLKDFYDQSDLSVTGMTDEMRYEQAKRQAEANAKANESSSNDGGDVLGSIFKMIGNSGEGGSMSEIPTAQSGMELVSSYYNQIQSTPNISNVIQSQTQSPGVNAGMYKSNGPANTSPVSSYGTFAPGNVNDWDIDNNGVPDRIQKPEGNPLGSYQIPQSQQPEQSGFDNAMDSISKLAGPVGELWQGYQALRGERRARKEAEQQKVVSDITLKASQTRPEEIKRKYVRPEDIQNTGEEFFPIYGVGTNVLAKNGAKLEDGGMIGGNPTEIQNTYAPNYDIYSDLEYTPLYNVNQQKSFRQGGYIPQAGSGWQNWNNSMSGGGSGFSGAGQSGGTPYGAIGSMATNIGQSAMGGRNAGGQIGGTIGKSIGSIWGPAGGAIGEFVGGIAGNALDTNAKQIKKYQNQTNRNIKMMALNSGFASVNAGNASYVRNGGDIPNYEDGGYMNPEYNPQVITMFGDLNAQDFAKFAHKDEFRAGGHLKSYTPPSERAMETFAMGGELETHWGGYAEPMSYNPYLPGTGETVMFRGKSHEEYSPNGETGIGITYGGNPVEVERGEPMVELQDGGAIDPETGEPQKSGVVFGNLQIPNQYIDLLGDSKAKGKKFKNYVADLSKDEEKQNKLIAKSTDELDALDVRSSFDRLKLASLEANIKGGNLKLKEIADKKINAASLQNAINETAEEYGLVADDLAKGKVKKDKEAMKEYAKFGGKFTKAKDGVTTTTDETTQPPVKKFKTEKEAIEAGYVKDGNRYVKVTPPEIIKPIETKSAKANKDIPLQHKNALGLYDITGEQVAEAQMNNPWFNWAGFDPANENDVKRFQNAFNARAIRMGSDARLEPDGLFGQQTASAKVEEKSETKPSAGKVEVAEVEAIPETKPIPYKRSPWIDLANTVLDYTRPTDQEEFNVAQIYPELYAMSSNQLEPVRAQSYQPELRVPYDISLQDQLNANQADYRAMQRIAGYNPAAQANLNAQKYQANQQILGNQFRANQEMKDRVYGENRNILNQAKLTNLGIYDEQYKRQSEALSNTKATTLAALNSISDKYAKNKLENRTLGIYENLYKYRFDKNGRAINMNGIFQPNIPTVGVADATQKQVPVYGPDGEIQYYQLEKTSDSKKPSLATPGIVSAKKGKTITKNNKNSSIVKAIKNL